MSGSTQASVCVMDSPSGATGDREPLREGVGIIHGRRVFEALGVHAAKPPVSGLMSNSRRLSKTGWTRSILPSPCRQKRKRPSDIGVMRLGCVPIVSIAGASRQRGTPVIDYWTRRFSPNMISARTNRGTLRFLVYRAGLKTDSFLAFLRRLSQGAPRKEFLILDNRTVHHAKKTRRWAEKHPDHIPMRPHTTQMSFSTTTSNKTSISDASPKAKKN